MKTTNNCMGILSFGIGFALCATPAFAVLENITIQDPNIDSGLTGWARAGSPTKPTWSEFGEVEPSMSTGFAWDLAAFTRDVDKKELGVLAGYPLASDPSTGGTRIGNIFISTNVPVGNYAGGAIDYNQYIKNGTVLPAGNGSAFGYEFAIKLNFSANKYEVWKLDYDTLLENGWYANPDTTNWNEESNPWRIAGTRAVGGSGLPTNSPGGTYGTYNLGTLQGTYNFASYQTGLTDKKAMEIAGLPYNSSTDNFLQNPSGSSATSLNPLGDIAYNNWNYLVLGDMDKWLVAPSSSTLYYHLTLECGNDNMIATAAGGFRTPDGGSTLILIGISIIGVMMGRRFINF